MQAAHRRAHRRMWQVLAVALPLLFILALLLRPGTPLEETIFEAPRSEAPQTETSGS